MKTIDIYGNFLDKNSPFLHIIRAFENDPRVQINLMGPAHRSLLEIQRRKYTKGSIALGLGSPRDVQGMHMGDYDAKLSYIAWETNKVPYGSSYGLKNVLQKMDMLLVPDEWQERLFEHTGNYIKVVPMASSIDKSKRNAIISDQFTFLCVGKLTHKTNMGYLISAVMSLSQKYPNIKLILKTEGGTLGHLQFPEKNIQIIDGDISEEDYMDLYTRANCFVYPTSADALPVELFNAIEMGLQIIAPTYGGFDIQNDLRKHELVPAKRYSKKLGEVGSYWSIDYDELVEKMENAIKGVNPYYGSNTSYQTAQEFVNDIIKLTRKLP